MIIKLSGKVPIDFLVRYYEKIGNYYISKNESDTYLRNQNIVKAQDYFQKANYYRNILLKDGNIEIDVDDYIYNEYLKTKSDFTIIENEIKKEVTKEITKENVIQENFEEAIKQQKELEEKQIKELSEEIKNKDIVYNILNNKILIIGIIIFVLILIIRR